MIILLCTMSCQLYAQSFSHKYDNVPIPEILKQLNDEQNKYTIDFIYNELEDFKVTASIHKQKVPDAIQQIIGFYPIKMTQKNDIILVECLQKNGTRYKGRIIDENDQPAEFANITLLSPADSTIIANGVSNEGGYFVIPCKAKKVIARISYVGYKTIKHVYKNPNIGTIQLTPSKIMIKGVTVKGYRPVYKKTNEGLLTIIENTALAKIGSAKDVIVHLPMIQKDGQGNLNVFGKGTPEIYINGRKVQDNNELTNLKSEDIKNIELITSPGAKYDATARAVIKINTITSKDNGFSFNVSSMLSKNDHDLNHDSRLSLNYRHQGFDFFDNFRHISKHHRSYNNMWQEIDSDTLWFQKNQAKEKYHSQSFENTIGINYAINDKNYIGTKYVITLCPKACLDNDISAEVTADNILYDHLNTKEEESTDARPAHQFNAYYNGKLNETTVDWNIDYLFNKTRKNSVSKEKSEMNVSRTVNSLNNIRNRMLASKLILGHPFAGGKLNIGTEYTNTDRNDNYINLQEIVPSSYAKLKEQHISPFVEYQKLAHGIGFFTLGIRYEHINFNYYENGKHIKDQSRKFNSVFPSISWSIQKGALQAQLAYSTKTKRPNYQELSNNVVYANRFLRNSGNPAIHSEYIHDLTLQGMYHWVQFSFSFNDIRHAIIWNCQQIENQPVNEVTHANIPSLKTFTPALVLAPRLGLYNPQLTIAINKQWLHLNGISFNKPILFCTFDNNFKFTDSFYGNLFFTYQGKGNYQNIYMNKISTPLNISLTKTFLHNTLSLQLTAKDIFKKRCDGNLIYSKAIRFYIGNTYDSRSIDLSVKYNFNTPHSKYKGTGAGNEEKQRL